MAALPVPRTKFPFPSQLPASWYIGHMSRAVRAINDKMSSIDLVLEARDARIPLTSVNPMFERLVSEKNIPRLVIYNKRDLAEERFEEPIRSALKKLAGHETLFLDSRSDSQVKRLLKSIASYARKPSGDAANVLVVGMPNVGKSSILNALRRSGVRKGKAFRTGPEAGITRRLTGVVKIYEDPQIYVYDTPGIMIPYLGKDFAAMDRILRLAVTAGIKESLFDVQLVADYLLFRLMLRWIRNPELDHDICHALGLQASAQSTPDVPSFPTNEISVLLSAVARRIGALRKGAEPDEDVAARWMIAKYREGALGRWTIDPFEVDSRPADLPFSPGQPSPGSSLEEAVFDAFSALLSKQQEDSANQIRKRERAAKSELARQKTRRKLAAKRASPPSKRRDR